MSFGWEITFKKRYGWSGKSKCIFDSYAIYHAILPKKHKFFKRFHTTPLCRNQSVALFGCSMQPHVSNYAGRHGVCAVKIYPLWHIDSTQFRTLHEFKGESLKQETLSASGGSLHDLKPRFGRPVNRIDSLLQIFILRLMRNCTWNTEVAPEGQSLAAFFCTHSYDCLQHATLVNACGLNHKA